MRCRQSRPGASYHRTTRMAFILHAVSRVIASSVWRIAVPRRSRFARRGRFPARMERAAPLKSTAGSGTSGPRCHHESDRVRSGRGANSRQPFSRRFMFARRQSDRGAGHARLARRSHVLSCGSRSTMHAFWIILGSAVLIVAFVDLFLVVLNYEETGFLATRLCRWQWYGLRSVTRRLSRRWRPVALRQVTGLNVSLCVTVWLGCIVIGFGFIYYGLMVGANFEYDGRGTGAGLFSAMYLSAAQLSTVGTSQINAQTDFLRALTIAETLCAPLLITLILTFLLGVYQVIRDLRTLSSNFSDAEHGAGDPIVNLEPYFPDGHGLDGYLQAIDRSFWAYADGLRMHHVAYFFQRGRDQFSLPYVLHMFGEILAALCVGLPAGNPLAKEPLLVRLSSQFERLVDY